MGFADPNLTNVNQLIAANLSMITAPFKYGNQASEGFEGIATNLIPYPKISLTVPSFAPWTVEPKANELSPSVNEITRNVLDVKNSLLSIPNFNKYISNHLTYFGDVTHQETVDSYYNFKEENKESFIKQFFPTSFKPCISSLPSITYTHNPIINKLFKSQSQVSAIINSGGINGFFKKVNERYDLIYAKRAYVHSFVGYGFESGAFSEVREKLAILERIYEEFVLEDQYYENNEE